jgi:hypothetical protein
VSELALGTMQFGGKMNMGSHQREWHCCTLAAIPHTRICTLRLSKNCVLYADSPQDLPQWT